MQMHSINGEVKANVTGLTLVDIYVIGEVSNNTNDIICNLEIDWLHYVIFIFSIISMKRLLQLLGVKEVATDTHEWDLPPTELKHPAYKIARLYNVIDWDKNSNLRLITHLYSYKKTWN